MFPYDESSEEHPDSFYQDGSYEENDGANHPSGKGCLIIMAIILILSLLLRYLQ
jgi:hypothetical protein